MQIRTRFAPSPTGFIHLGNLRSALYPWAFARHHQGDFILRIEDTDLERSTQESVDVILEGMAWLGLDVDEGPIYQMQRIDRYREVIKQMLDSGLAYPCYMSEDELNRLRDQQMANKEKPRYNGLWRPEPGKTLPAVPPGVSPVIRFKNPIGGSVIWDDAVKGRIEISNEELDDLVIARPDGTPTYNFCVVVDDLDMKITHVIRGDDHVNNTPRQINILKALGASPPIYAHLPTVLNDQGEKMSKRNGAMSVRDYQKEGYLPEAILNYLARLGWSHGDAEVFTKEQFVAWFDLDNLGRSPAQHNPEKLLWLNHHYIQEADPEQLAEAVRPFAEERGIDVNQGPNFVQVVALLKDRANTLIEIAEGAKLFYSPAPELSPEQIAQNIPETIQPVLRDLIDAISSADSTKEGYSAAFKEVLAKHQLKMPALAMPVRYALFATTQTPAIDSVLLVLGKEESLQRLAKVLYPDADIRHQPFEEARLADGFYDVAISNIPFGDYQPFDPRFNVFKFPIHDYFFAAALEKVRPGGLLLFITSKGTLDKEDSTLREYLAQRANFVGAIRLPNDAFRRNANTEVTTDIVMLRKLNPGETPSGPAWNETAEHTKSKGETIYINEYFAQRPRMMLGEMELSGRMYRDNEPTLVSDGRNLAEALEEAVSNLPQNIYLAQKRAVTPPTLDQAFPAPDHVKPNAFVMVHDNVAVRVGDSLKTLPGLPAETRVRIRRLIRVRDGVRECLRSQLNGSSDADIVAARELLNQAYDSFVSRFGPISGRVNTRAFDGDPDLPLLLSLEVYDEETKRATKTAIFRERTIHYQKPIESVEFPKEALIVSLNEKGRVDLEHMSALLGRSVAEFQPELKGAIFLNPQSNEWETDDQYLSGNVREKLETAEAASLTDPRFKENVEALQAVQPEDLAATEIDVRLGAAWVPAEDIEKFCQELLGATDVEVSHSHAIGTWVVAGDYFARRTVANTTEWGTDRAGALDLIQDALNLRTPTIYDKEPGSDKSIVNAAATEGAREKQEKIKERFKEWIWQDDSRRERLCRLYNDEFNNVRLQTFNGDHLTLPGASQAVTLHAHQKAAVWRVLQTPNTLLGHVVGAGKTYTMVAAGMELKRLGLAQKPLFVVPNHMLGQFSSELLTLYPGANILVAGKEDFKASKRRQLMSRIATGNWDAVIVTHSGFERIPVSDETKKGFFREQLHELEMAIREQRTGKNDRRIVKDLERAKKRLETRLQLLLAEEKKDNTLTFEELGVDRLFIDEAHYFKNLFYVSKMTRIAGLPQTASERAFDLFLKTRYIQQVNGGGGVVFATGTPISNSVAEMFTMQRYLQMTALTKLRVHHFDSWAATFGEPVTAMELAPDGAGYRLNTRFARFVNVPELMQQFRQVADIHTAQTLKLPTPALRNGKATIIRAPTTPELKALVAGLAERAERLRKGRVDPREDNMLKITTEGRKAALDLRLVDGGARDNPESKANLAVHEILRIWQETKADRLAQLVFCDLSTPKDTGFSVYDDVKAKLVIAGVPAAEIAFIQEYDSDAAKLSLFKDVRAGKVRILMGSTQKMGSGTNVQERLVALHHLDAPWRPSDVEQREGRILRQGNRNAEVQIYRYVTEGSFDAYMWQTLETKAKFIHQVMTGRNDLRRIEDIDGAALTYAEVKAIASGNPLVIEKAHIDAEVGRLGRLRAQHHETQYRIRSTIRRSHEEIEILTRRIENLHKDIAARRPTQGDAFNVLIEGTEYTDRGIAGELINRRAQQLRGSGKEYKIGELAGFAVVLRASAFEHTELVLKGANLYSASISDSAHGTMRSLEHTVSAFDDKLAQAGKAVEECRKRMAELESKVGEPFEHETKLTNLTQRQEEIVKALDLTRNQASNRLDTAVVPDGEDAVAEKIARSVRQIRHSHGVSVH